MIIHTAIHGLGTVGQNLLKLLDAKKQVLLERYDLEFKLICAADSSGVAIDTFGLDIKSLLATKASGLKVQSLSTFSQDETFCDAIKRYKIDLVFEASPVELKTGGEGLKVFEAALEKGISVISANKAPLVLRFSQLTKLAKDNHARLGYSACVCGGMPIINLVQRDIIGATITRLSGVLNNTTNYILSEMTKGKTFEAALAEAQQRGIAERDSSLDIGGWDSANKLLIIANSVLGLDLSLGDVSVAGIADITQEDVRREKVRGKVFKLIACAENGELSVGPQAIPKEAFLAQCMTVKKV